MQSGSNAGGPNGYDGLSFAPVGLDLGPMVDGDLRSIDVNLAGDPLPARRATPSRKLGRRVAGGALAGILLLTVAAFARSSYRNAEPHGVSIAPIPTETDPSADPPSVVPPAASLADPVVVAPPPTTGTVRLRRPAFPGRVWLDGTKLTAASSLVSCGTHQIRVGARSRPRPIDVPCGAQIEITR